MIDVGIEAECHGAQLLEAGDGGPALVGAGGAWSRRAVRAAQMVVNRPRIELRVGRAKVTIDALVEIPAVRIVSGAGGGAGDRVVRVREGVVVLAGVGGERDADLAQLVRVRGHQGSCTHSRNDREGKSREHDDDGDHHQQLDHGEAGFAGCRVGSDGISHGNRMGQWLRAANSSGGRSNFSSMTPAELASWPAGRPRMRRYALREA